MVDASHIRDKAKGRVVLCGGVFDIVHPGHVFFLSEARKLGDFLVVVVARDSTAKRLKRRPVVPEIQRREMVEALKPVDAAILGHEGGNFMEIVMEIRPDVIALGHNQVHDEDEIRKRILEIGIECEIRRIDKIKKGTLLSTKRIMKKIIETCKK